MLLATNKCENYHTILSTGTFVILIYMPTDAQIQNSLHDISQLATTPNAFRSVLILILSLILAYWLSRFLSRGIVRVAQIVAVRSDNASDDLHVMRLRQTETYLSIAVAVVRALVVVIVGYYAWRLLSPYSDNPSANSVAAIGAGTVFVVVAGQTIGIILRDLTAGSVMITEGWYKIGDFIKIEPFMEVAGVVERFTLRSTRLRALNGEIIWVHNQNITGAHITPKGVRTQEVEIFLRDLVRGKAAVEKIITAMPRGKMMLSKPLKIVREEQWHNNEWHLTVRGQTPPGREWLIEDYFLQAIIDIDPVDTKPARRILARPPLVHMADPTANRKFQRSVRVRDE